MKLHAQSSKTNISGSNFAFHHIAPCGKNNEGNEGRSHFFSFCSLINNAQLKLVGIGRKMCKQFDVAEFSGSTGPYILSFVCLPCCIKKQLIRTILQTKMGHPVQFRQRDLCRMSCSLLSPHLLLLLQRRRKKVCKGVKML